VTRPDRRLEWSATRHDLPVLTEGDELNTRSRILQAAWKIIDEKGETAATMIAVAKLANVSRQAVYLHFSDRSHLLSSLSTFLDERMGLGGWMQEVEALNDGAAMVRRVAETRFKRSLVMAPLIRSIEGNRYRDEAAAKAWKRRHEMNVTWMADVVVRQLATEGKLHASWNHAEAATLLTILFSFRAWDDLTQIHDWPPKGYVEILTSVALSMLAGPAQR
jgi:AcrR family transcriptional regulator